MFFLKGGIFTNGKLQQLWKKLKKIEIHKVSFLDNNGDGLCVLELYAAVHKTITDDEEV